jgi:hypothetical protein
MNPLSNQNNYFELLPEPIIGHILDQLNIVTGSKGIVNEADISVVMRYTCNLACTSKKMTAKVSHLDATRIFLKSLSNKYGQSCEHFAALLNTIGARKWVWKSIKEIGLSESIISCNKDWKDKNSSGMYLWIRKDSQEKALEVLNISLA